VKENAQNRQKVSLSFAKSAKILITEFYRHENLLITQHAIGQTCTLFSKARPGSIVSESSPGATGLLAVTAF